MGGKSPPSDGPPYQGLTKGERQIKKKKKKRGKKDGGPGGGGGPKIGRFVYGRTKRGFEIKEKLG